MRSRWSLLAGTLAVIIAGCFVGWYYYLKYASDKELQEAIEQADRLDPGWRLEELEAKRTILPDAENSAQQVLAIKKLMPNTWPSPAMTKAPQVTKVGGKSDQDLPVSIAIELSELPPEVQLSADQIRQLRLELEAVKEPLAMARGLSRFHGGRFPVKWSLDYLSTSLTCQDCRAVANLLSYDAKLRVQEGDLEGAFASIVC